MVMMLGRWPATNQADRSAPWLCAVHTQSWPSTKNNNDMNEHTTTSQNRTALATAFVCVCLFGVAFVLCACVDVIVVFAVVVLVAGHGSTTSAALGLWVEAVEEIDCFPPSLIGEGDCFGGVGWCFSSVRVLRLFFVCFLLCVLVVGVVRCGWSNSRKL